MPNSGFLYVLAVKNLSLPVCKIGMTTRTPEERCNEINKSSTGDFLWAISTAFNVEDCRDAERYVHKELELFRQKGREFFGLYPDDAADRIRTLIASMGGVEVPITGKKNAPKVKQAKPSIKELHYAELLQSFLSYLEIKGKPFGQTGADSFGVSDGTEGIQWSLVIYPKENKAFVTVNLEGMKYQGWPIARLLLAERKSPSLLSIKSPKDQIFIRMVRDAWRRPLGRDAIMESAIGGCLDICLKDLSPDKWVEIVEESLGCLNEDKNYMGRARQLVTLKVSKRVVEKEVTPHLNVLTPIKIDGSDIQDAVDRLRPFYMWLSSRINQDY